MKDIFVNNLYYYTTELIAVYGASTTLLLIGSFLVVATFLKSLKTFNLKTSKRSALITLQPHTL